MNPTPNSLKDNKPFVLWFDQISLKDVPLVGGKNASLGEMYSHLSSKGIKVPNGFATTAEAYRFFLSENRLEEEIKELLSGLDPHDLENLRDRGRKIRALIIDSPMPKELENEIIDAYAILNKEAKQPAVDVAVRSSATAEDLPGASFAGQQETYLNVRGKDNLLHSIKKCFASLFTDRAISYRSDMGFEHTKVALSVGVQRMVRSDLACSGVMFSIDTESGFHNAVLINSSYGLGENIVQGIVNPDEFYVFKPTLMQGFQPILQKRLGGKEMKLVYDIGGEKIVKNIPVPPEERKKFSLSDEEILTLAKWACIVEEHYSQLNGRFTPMDMEWAKDGLSGELFMLQARPETVHGGKERNVLEFYRLKGTGPVLVEGRSVGEKIVHGKIKIIKSIQQIDRFEPGEILVTEKTDPDWEPIMKKARAIVTNRGGRTCHAAIVSRELGVPAIVGTERGTEILKDGMIVTVSCAEGEVGKVYNGEIPFEIEKVNLQNVPRPRTKIMMNVGNPEEAFDLSFLPNDGVGLAREEFILTNYVRIHPMALVHFDQLKEGEDKKKIIEMTEIYPKKTDFFVEKLAEGIGMIAAAFYPKDVIVRLSDFKTNEYANLIGGQDFEPIERNPMIGFRGASRYYNPRYQEGFALECQAIRRARETFGLFNIKVMVPVVRTVEEGKKVIAEMEKNGLKKGEKGLEIYMMCEIPSNVILAEEFSEIFDGFSIGSNDLTQLVLGVDRDSEIVASLYDERNEAVKRMISSVIRTAKQKQKKIGICGEAPSNYPEFAEFLVKEGIDSLSLSADVVIKTTLSILELEKNLFRAS
ncbi:phosphoenolpyruvate synthase [Candidatus Methylacidiphilum fumarolicum]|uniref:Phosphoenolpyruvate synthase n=2 Tax=Candidatus Methylacidiphilum fumarolicum TaxID=591154 RepID=I0K1E1_METFB|nr:phosphoenolpyruvate synthase [Candidatus Methylacidiphilum fumarolicum]MBW6414934.1 phosphoenolpyruvate synthase [Candidatus Methylacidiphilum fumarolicum]TFE70373.1 phosphoenolpyruvate synthase [Candidatus Methylacidiphilum fumarolicum]TFE73946.1 phosphoenolpyruvate synthase [Candidatus Methylacidiphilum fumarolicum]TFE74452.1 phosphoenolpyruvate synthase [Candidatus Methylacidiphilum fumarolicum]TFE77886.1 phosphoenolpyruvate synthase [Candidatus Methylacidiphilum fumarolicum]